MGTAFLSIVFSFVSYIVLEFSSYIRAYGHLLRKNILLFAVPKAKAQPPEPVGHSENIFKNLFIF